MMASRRSRSAAVTSTTIPVRITQPRTPEAPRESNSGLDRRVQATSGYVGGGYAFGKAGLYEQGFRLRAVGAFGRYHYDGALPVDGVYVPTTFEGQDAF